MECVHYPSFITYTVKHIFGKSLNTKLMFVSKYSDNHNFYINNKYHILIYTKGKNKQTTNRKKFECIGNIARLVRTSVLQYMTRYTLSGN